MADTTRPTIVISTYKSRLKAGETALISFNLSEVATDFELTDITVTEGTLSNFSGSGTNYSAIYTPNAKSSTTGTLRVGDNKFSDEAGNWNKVGKDDNNNLFFIINTFDPIISISNHRSFLGQGETPTITFSLTAPSTNFDITDILITGGTLSNFKGSGTSYSALLTPTGSNYCIVYVPDNRFTFDGGYGNQASSHYLFVPFSPSNANVDWNRFVPTGSIDSASGITYGKDQFIYIVGNLERPVLDGQINSGSGDAFVTKYSLDGNKAWTRLIGSKSQDRAYEITTGNDGAIYIAGKTASYELDGQFNSGSYDTLISKFSSDGSKVWTRLLGTKEDDAATALTTGIDGSIYVSGYTSGSLDGQTNSGERDAYLAKFNTDGTKIWTRLLGTSKDESSQALTSGTDGSIYVGGNTTGNLDGQINSGGIDAFVTKYNSDGSKVWTRLIGTSGIDIATALATGVDGSIYVSGYTSGSLDGQTNSGKNDAFISKYNSDGSKAWTRLLEGAGNQQASALTIGNDGSIYVSGTTEGNLNGQTSVGFIDSFVSKYKSDGSRTWTRLIPTTSADGITIDPYGSIYVTGSTGSYPITTLGYYTGNVAIIDGFEQAGTRDAFVIKLTTPDTTSNASPPKIEVSSSKSYLSVGESTNVNFTLTKSSTSFALSDIVVLGGTLSNFEGSGISYNANFTANIEGLNGASISVGNGKFSDALGVLNDDGTEANNKVYFSISAPVDTTPPTITLISSASNNSNIQTATITFILSEASTTFNASDINVTGGTLSNFSGNGKFYTAFFTLTLNSLSSGSISVPSGVFSDLAGNTNEDGLERNNSITISHFTNIVWSNLSGSSSEDRSSGITKGTDGSIYVTGVTNGNLDGQINNGNYDSFLTKYKPDGTKAWTKLLGSNGTDWATSIATGIDGAIYISGYTSSNLDSQINKGGYDAFLTKFNPDGSKAWTQLSGTNLNDLSFAITTGKDGYVYVTGETKGNLDSQINSGNYDVFLTKYNPEGTKIWTRLLGTNLVDVAFAATTSLDGSIYLSGRTEYNLDGIKNNGSSDAFLTKYSSDGTKLWTRLFGSGGNEYARAVSTSIDGSIYVAGYTGSSIEGLVNSGENDVFLTKYDAEGTKIWAVFLGTSSNDEGFALTTDANGAIYVSGYTEGNLDSQTNSGFYDVFLTKFSPDGTKAWTNLIGSDVDDYSYALTIGIDNSIFLSGATNGNFNGHKNNGGLDAFVIKLLVSGFAPSDVTPPTPITFSPTLGEVNVDVGRNIIINFNEKIQRGTGVIEIRLGHPTLGSLLESFDVAKSDRLTFDGTTLTINPTRDLKGNYYLFIYLADGAVQDSAGNKSASISNYTITTANQITTENYLLSVLVNKGVLGAEPVLLKGLNESFVFENGYTKKHTVEYAGSTFDYNQIYSLITTVTRDGEFTSEFTKEINDYFGTELNITYSAAVKLVGASSIDGVIISVAGADGNFVG
jgi:uncharacterized delta-60 repeat protein